VTTPIAAPTTDGMLAQILVEQGKQGTRLAVISEKLSVLPDHEDRLRALERFRFTLMGAVVVISALFSAGATWIGLIVTRR
jgi:hypothetical protein